MLQLTATASATTLSTNGQGRANLTLTYSALDTDPFISKGLVSVDWGDGDATAIGPDTLPLTGELIHGYPPGRYVVRVTAQNYRQPRPQTVKVHREITVLVPNRAESDATAILFGPILPQTNSYPSPSEWAFNLGRDSTTLCSSLLMLFYTRVGERIHDPAYGSRLHELIFSLGDGDLVGAVREEVARAVAQHEPRVEYVGSNVQLSENGRVCTVQAEFVSKLNGAPLVLELGFAT